MRRRCPAWRSLTHASQIGHQVFSGTGGRGGAHQRTVCMLSDQRAVRKSRQSRGRGRKLDGIGRGERAIHRHQHLELVARSQFERQLRVDLSPG